MSIVVQKYGGSVLKDFNDLEKVSNNIISTLKRGNNVIAVVSALKGETDQLIKFANTVNDHPDPRELDMLISTGEQKTGALLSLVLQGKNIPSISFTGHQIGIITDSEYGNASILKINTEVIENELALGKVVIIAGFQGVNQLEEITTLGRGGSDLTAVAIGIALKSEIVEFYKDTGQIYTNNPELGEGKAIKKIDYSTLLKLTSGDFKIIASKAVELAKKYNIPLVIKNFENDKQSLIVSEDFFFQEEKYLAVAQQGLEYQIIIKEIEHEKLLKLLNRNINANYLDRVNINTSSNFLLTFDEENTQKIKDILSEEGYNFEISGPFLRMVITGWGFTNFKLFYQKIYSLLNAEIKFYDVHFSKYSVSLLIDQKDEKKLISNINRINNGKN